MTIAKARYDLQKQSLPPLWVSFKRSFVILANQRPGFRSLVKNISHFLYFLNFESLSWMIFTWFFEDILLKKIFQLSSSLSIDYFLILTWKLVLSIEKVGDFSWTWFFTKMVIISSFMFHFRNGFHHWISNYIRDGFM